MSWHWGGLKLKLRIFLTKIKDQFSTTSLFSGDMGETGANSNSTVIWWWFCPTRPSSVHYEPQQWHTTIHTHTYTNSQFKLDIYFTPSHFLAMGETGVPGKLMMQWREQTKLKRQQKKPDCYSLYLCTCISWEQRKWNVMHQRARQWWPLISGAAATAEKNIIRLHTTAVSVYCKSLQTDYIIPWHVATELGHWV